MTDQPPPNPLPFLCEACFNRPATGIYTRPVGTNHGPRPADSHITVPLCNTCRDAR